MDALLSYLMFKISFKIIILEFIVMILCCLAIIAIKILTKRRNEKRKKSEDSISNAIATALFPTKDAASTFSLPPGNYTFKNFVDVFESYDHRFSDERWETLKRDLIKKYILVDAKKNIDSRSWLTRQLSARTFLLDPSQATEEDLYKLIQDPKYLVRVIAAAAITKTPYRKLFREVFRKMREETPLSRFFYRDALVNCDREKFSWMEELLKVEQDPKISALILDVLSTRCSSNLFEVIKPFTHSGDRECRLLAIRALGSISLAESTDLLIRHMEDSDWEIRAESIEGIRKQHVIKAIPELESLLSDPIWWVRLQAANTLKSFGDQGKKILKSQDTSKNPLASEIAAYSLSL